MFTGIVEEMGTVVACLTGERSGTLEVQAATVLQGTQIGESIAVNGCCLTVIAQKGETLTFDVMPETLARTNLGGLQPGDPVNLERPLAANGRLGGHFVQGHIDGVGTVSSLQADENAVIVEIETPAPLRRYLVEKGSIAVDGVSLTVAEVRPTSFTVWTIPHTRAITTLGRHTVGARVNLECDLIGKYIERLLLAREGEG